VLRFDLGMNAPKDGVMTSQGSMCNLDDHGANFKADVAE
jgi:hypothetical protein